MICLFCCAWTGAAKPTVNRNNVAADLAKRENNILTSRCVSAGGKADEVEDDFYNDGFDGSAEDAADRKCHRRHARSKPEVMTVVSRARLQPVHASVRVSR